MHIKEESDGGYCSIHIHVVRLRNTGEVVIWISITCQTFKISELKFQMKPFPITSFDSSSRSKRIHFHPSTKTISNLSQTQTDPSPFNRQLWNDSSVWGWLVCMCVYVRVCVWERARKRGWGGAVESNLAYSTNFHLEWQEINVEVQTFVLQTWM